MIDHAPHQQALRLGRLVAFSLPIILSLAGALAYVRAQWEPAQGVFLLAVAVAATAVGASVVRLWMGETALSGESRLPFVHGTVGYRDPALTIEHGNEATFAGWGQMMVFFIQQTGDGFVITYGPGRQPEALPLRVADLEQVLMSGASRAWRGGAYSCVAFSEADMGQAEWRRLSRRVETLSTPAPIIPEGDIEADAPRADPDRDED